MLMLMYQLAGEMAESIIKFPIECRRGYLHVDWNKNAFEIAFTQRAVDKNAC